MGVPLPCKGEKRLAGKRRGKRKARRDEIAPLPPVNFKLQARYYFVLTE